MNAVLLVLLLGQLPDALPDALPDSVAVESSPEAPEITRAFVWSASWCGPCRNLRPTILRLRAEGWAIVEKDYDTDSGERIESDITTVPTIQIGKGLQERDRRLGILPPENLRRWFAESGVELIVPEGKTHVITTGVQIGLKSVGSYSYQKFFEGTEPGERGFWDALREWAKVCNISFAGAKYPACYIGLTNNSRVFGSYSGSRGRGSIYVSVSPSIVKVWPKKDYGYLIGIHEFGHFLGLRDNGDPKSVMSIRTARPDKPGPADIRSVQSIWGNPLFPK